MIAHNKVQNTYVGPKALFDQEYIPPKLLYREKETESLYSLLSDSLTDGFSLNVLYQGIQGIGKKVLVNKVIKDITDNLTVSNKICKIAVNCSEKSLEEILLSIIADMFSFQNLNIEYNAILNSNVSELWSLFKLLGKKIKDRLVFIFNDVEEFKPGVFKKFLQYGKEININFISTINKAIKPSSLDILSQFDLKKKLNYFSYHELFEILKQRVKLTFSTPIDNHLIEFITDLIFEQYVPVPGKGIDVLKELYPFLNQQNDLKTVDIMAIIQNQFDSSHLVDEFNLLNFFSDADLLNVIFLDNLSNYFLKSNNFYISSNHLADIYDISCESVEYEKNPEEFENMVSTLMNIGIINNSKKKLSNLNADIEEELNSVDYFFTSFNPTQLKAIADSIFN